MSCPLLRNSANIAGSFLQFDQIIIANFLGELKHLSFKRRNEVLRASAFQTNQIDNPLKVNGVERRIYLIENIKRCRFAFLECHQNAKSKHTFLPAWKLWPLFCNFSFRLKRDHDRNGISRFGKSSRFLLASFKPNIGFSVSYRPKNSLKLFLKLVKNLAYIQIFFLFALI